MRSMSKILNLIIAIAVIGAEAEVLSQPVRVKDLANVRGFRSNSLVGFGLVMGLAKSGDSKSSLATNQALVTMMNRLGLNANPETTTGLGSVAAVIVTGELDAYKRNGDKIDVKVSSIGDAKSLAGGTLLLTPLKAGDGQIYVVAQGAVVVGQASGSGPQVLTTANIPQGGSVEREFQPTIAPRGVMTLSLKIPDFTTSTRLSEAINTHLRGLFARALDPVSVEVRLPDSYQDRSAEFVAEIEGLYVDSDQRAVVVLNERTGTVVMGAGVAISKIAISHGDLSIQVGGAKSGAKGATPKRVVDVGGATVGELIESLNTMGMKPADLVGILQTVHAAGALKADLKFM